MGTIAEEFNNTKKAVLSCFIIRSIDLNDYYETREESFDRTVAIACSVDRRSVDRSTTILLLLRKDPRFKKRRPCEFQTTRDLT